MGDANGQNKSIRKKNITLNKKRRSRKCKERCLVTFNTEHGTQMNQD